MHESDPFGAGWMKSLYVVQLTMTGLFDLRFHTQNPTGLESRLIRGGRAFRSDTHDFYFFFLRIFCPPVNSSGPKVNAPVSENRPKKINCVIRKNFPALFARRKNWFFRVHSVAEVEKSRVTDIRATRARSITRGFGNWACFDSNKF